MKSELAPLVGCSGTLGRLSALPENKVDHLYFGYSRAWVSSAKTCDELTPVRGR
jgi:hypothetical protein